MLEAARVAGKPWKRRLWLRYRAIDQRFGCPDRTHKPQPSAPFYIIRTPDQTDNTGAVTTTPENPYLRDAVWTATQEQLQIMRHAACIRYAL